MKETRAKFIPPPTPKEDMKDIVLYIRRLNVLLPGFLDQMQRIILEAQSQSYDIFVPVGEADMLEDLESVMALSGSAGMMTAFTITVVNATTVQVSACTVQIRATDDSTATLIQFDMAQANVTVTASQANYIGVEYNSGSPQFVSRATNNYNRNSEFLIALVYPEAA